ncbi:MAG: DMT family transporter [Candidatus Pelagibacterales bacterium]|jgi:DME family drug/metabolite transporter|tara:strand:+ start:542 stop:1471 length:930 start_codon:yes stop_codon:yes gene_type:complete
MSDQTKNLSLELNKTYFLGFLLAISAGIIWSFGAPTVRHMVDAELYQWHYLFVRGIVVASILLIFLVAKEGTKFVNNFKKVGISGIIGGVGLACAFIGFIFGMTNTSAATTLFLIALQPLFAGLLAYLFLSERIRSATFIAMIISIFGISLMVYNDWMIGALFGVFAGFICSLGFSVFAVTLRWKPETPKFTTIIIAGLICAAFSFMMVITFSEHTTMPLKNILLSMLHGSFVASGLILISYGSKYLPAAELMLLATMETVGGILWCWLPIFGVNEVPGTNTLIGGMIIIFAITFHAIGTRQKVIPPTL